MLLSRLEFIYEHFHSFLFFTIPPFTFWQKKIENNKANIIKFRWMLIWAFWGYSTFCNLLVLEQSGIKTVAYFTSTLLVTMPYFWPTSKKTTMCSFLCTWTNFHQGQMILCIATANLFLFMDFFFPPTEVSVTRTKKDSNCSVSDSFCDASFSELFQRCLTFIVLARTITEDLKESFKISWTHMQKGERGGSCEILNERKTRTVNAVILDLSESFQK